jgi:hypothetical protein|tara:strand:+ start:621 stop:872 length:252 start_codon:yes stop_codon:yes gene_type:complete
MSKDKEENHLEKWLNENKESVLAQMNPKTPQMERLMIAMQNAMELERSKYDDWDDNKHYLKVELIPLNNALQIHVTRKEKSKK